MPSHKKDRHKLFCRRIIQEKNPCESERSFDLIDSCFLCDCATLQDWLLLVRCEGKWILAPLRKVVDIANLKET